MRDSSGRSWLPAVLAAALVAAACGSDPAPVSSAAGASQPPAAPAAATAPAPAPQAAAPAVPPAAVESSTDVIPAAYNGPLPPLPDSGSPPARSPEVVQAVYEYAARHPEVLHYVPCFCGCERHGHKNNDD